MDAIDLGLAAHAMMIPSVLMDEHRKQRIDALRERIFLLQIEERRICALLARPTRHEELRANYMKDLNQVRFLLEAFSKELNSIDEWSRPQA